MRYSAKMNATSIATNFKITFFFLFTNQFVFTDSARNLGVVIDGLTSMVLVALIAQSVCFALNDIKRIRLYRTQLTSQLLVQVIVISPINDCNSLSRPPCMYI